MTAPLRRLPQTSAPLIGDRALLIGDSALPIGDAEAASVTVHPPFRSPTTWFPEGNA